MKDALVICTDGLRGFPEAIEAVYPKMLVQTCIVHWKERNVCGSALLAEKQT